VYPLVAVGELEAPLNLGTGDVDFSKAVEVDVYPEGGFETGEERAGFVWQFREHWAVNSLQVLPQVSALPLRPDDADTDLPYQAIPAERTEQHQTIAGVLQLLTISEGEVWLWNVE
jgi:hypothetical protein